MIVNNLEKCIPVYTCELDENDNKTGYMLDGCGNKELNESECPAKVQDNTRILYLGAAFMAGVLFAGMFKKV